jgi:hypothetical protein
VPLREELAGAGQSPEGVLTTLRKLREQAEAIAGHDRSALERLTALFARDGDLRQAVNETVALLTPARWAYVDVVPEARLEGAEESVELQAGQVELPDGRTEGISARFLLNTAELNTLALAIFLLCARNADNPLRVLVLDDPLQNMDELTVITIARGLGRLLRLWRRQGDGGPGGGPPWRLLLLAHGEDDVERIRGEVACAAYFLPWLSPGDGTAAPAIGVEARPSLLAEELQPLDALLAPTPR